MKTPLKSLKTETGHTPVIHNKPYGWLVQTSDPSMATLAWHSNLRLCRLTPDKDTDLVQLGIGRVRNARSDTLFAPQQDEALVFSGNSVSIEPSGKQGWVIRWTGPLHIQLRRDVMRSERTLPWYKPMSRKHFSRPPAGWCSWYIHYLKVTQKDVVRATDWLANHLKPYGLEWVQIDDGWQGLGEGLGNNRDWHSVCKKDFPKGMKWSADYIRKKGLRPGIWCIPFAQSDSKKFETCPEMFVRLANGRSTGERDKPLKWPGFSDDALMCDWMGKYTLDPTHPKARKELRDLYTLLCEKWGYDYVKIDAQGIMAEFFEKHREQLHDPSLPGDEVYRLGLQAMRKAMGPKRFLLNCGYGWDATELCEGIRTGDDVICSWDGMAPAIDNTMKYLWMNNLCWYTDPDVVCLRKPLTTEQARVWATLVGITGQVLMFSDDMAALPENRVELAKRILPVGDVIPLDLYPAEKRASVFDLRVNKPGVGEWDVVACFNWSKKSRKRIRLSAERLGLETRHEGYIWFDFWKQKVIANDEVKISFDLAPTTCRVLAIRKCTSHPQVVGTSRHLLQGADDIEKLQWNPRTGVLSGRCRVVAGDPYCISIHVPDGWKTSKPISKNRVLVVELTSRKSRSMDWSVKFT